MVVVYTHTDPFYLSERQESFGFWMFLVVYSDASIQVALNKL